MSNKTNSETVQWLSGIQSSSQEDIFNLAKQFFINIKSSRKESVVRGIYEYRMMHYKKKLNIQRKIQKEKNGSGKNHENPPESYFPQDFSFLNSVENNNGILKCKPCDLYLSCEPCNVGFIENNELKKHFRTKHKYDYNKSFRMECKELVLKDDEYCKWLDEIANIENVTFVSEEENNCIIKYHPSTPPSSNPSSPPSSL